MKNKRLIYFLGFLLAAFLLITPKGWTQPRPEIKGPIITHSFAVEKGPYGYIWKIYIEGKATDAEMLKIASVVEQTGYGHYPTDWIYLKPQFRKHFKGYIQWNTYSSRAPYLREWTQIYLKVSIIDKAGNESNEVIFPFEFVSGVKDPYRYELPSSFDQRNLSKLGNIFIDLFEPTAMGDGDNRD
jgi:hypothetical protein